MSGIGLIPKLLSRSTVVRPSGHKGKRLIGLAQTSAYLTPGRLAAAARLGVFRKPLLEIKNNDTKNRYSARSGFTSALMGM
jgi:hypothetical protein